MYHAMEMLISIDCNCMNCIRNESIAHDLYHLHYGSVPSLVLILMMYARIRIKFIHLTMQPLIFSTKAIHTCTWTGALLTA